MNMIFNVKTILIVIKIVTDQAYKSISHFIVIFIGNFFTFNFSFFYLIVTWGSVRFPCVRIGAHKPLNTY